MNQNTEDVYKQFKKKKIERKSEKLKKIKNKMKKIFIIILFILINFLGFINSVHATNLSSANIYCIGDCGQLLKYKGSTVKVSYVQYSDNGVDYPAYCLDRSKPGAETGAYDVTVSEAINDVGLWRRVINGYPYKTLEELGVATKEEAFTATKQAIYCYIHGNNPEDYSPIGEAGTRTLNAMKKIISDAENSTETKITSTIQINKNISSWKQDDLDKKYLSKTFSVTAMSDIQNYKITLTKLTGEEIEKIKITDLNNIEKQEFAPNENFKILIPIKNMKKEGEFELKVEAKVKTKPVLYGKAPNSNYQDYALTLATYEDGEGTIIDKYPLNETKIIIIKQDEETKEKLANVEFEILNEKKEVVYTGLKTNEKGIIEIENVLPGKYYIKETTSANGYTGYEQLIEINLDFNEQITVTVNNKKEEIPQVKINKEKTSKSVKTLKTLPVTGM